jgi:hypothetical protein
MKKLLALSIALLLTACTASSILVGKVGPPLDVSKNVSTSV